MGWLYTGTAIIEPRQDLNWKERPSFRFTKCDEKLPFICERIRRTPGPCLSSPVKIEKSEDEKFNTNLEFNLGIDTEQLIRNIGLEQLGIDIEGPAGGYLPGMLGRW